MTRVASSLLASVRSCGASLVTRALVTVLLLLSTGSSASASGPRWRSGPPYFTTIRTLISWYTTHPLYFTDAGDLSPSVSHADADAMVARAAAVWNIPTASLVLAQGGTLAEHVSSANVYATAAGPVFPSDVQAANFASKQIAILYDTDGSVTDTLLGTGASDPSGCLQNAVTESVDGLSPQAQIYHAILVLNGRCAGPAPEQQLQMQYQLMRAFGRILGLSWSQTNDNVFTGAPSPTYSQALNWPIMHPIDIVCGTYTYQCLPQPFTLRPDDISSLEDLYFIARGQAPAGKAESWSNAGGAYGYATFPNGQGMEGVNVVVRRRPPYFDTPECWQIASTATGAWFRGQGATPVAVAGASAAASFGMADLDREGYWRIRSIPIPTTQDWNDIVVTTEPINPLYTGAYAIGPQVGETITPSGSPQVQVSQYLANGRDLLVNFAPPDAAATCSAQADGTELAPSPMPQGGWWSGTICGYQHSAWNAIQVKANRSLTMEVTALDEQGLVSSHKAMPVLGAWQSTDPQGTLPTVASATAAFNSLSVGMTSMRVQSSASTNTYRVSISDQRGAGRPDFAYQARALYADAISPSSIGADGGTVTITGMGFRQGNAVLVNGVPATVLSWSSTAIVATVPSLHTLGRSTATVADITVQDLSTGGDSVMSGALTYAAPVEALQLVSAPTDIVTVGAPAPSTFSVKAIAPDGFTPVVGEAVAFTATGAGATFDVCNAATCTLTTNATGIASAHVKTTYSGGVALVASGRSGRVSTSYTSLATADLLHVLDLPRGVLTSGAFAATTLRIQLLSPDGVTPRIGSSITLTLGSGQARFGACPGVPCSLLSDASGTVSTSVMPLSKGTISVQISSGSTTANATFSAAAETMQPASAPAPAQTVGVASSTPFAVKVIAGDGTTPVAGESVVFTATGAAVTFGACGRSVCTVTTDSSGIAQTSVLATAAGSVTLSAVGNAGVVTAAFHAVAPPDLLHPVSAPAGTVYLGDPASTPFAVRITAADGVTPVVGTPVAFSAAAGTVTFAACSTPVCVVLTDASGLASTTVYPTSAGQLSLLAASDAGSTTAAFAGAVRVRSIAAARPLLYIAEGASVTWTQQVTLSDNSASIAGVPVAWSGAPGLSVSTALSTTGQGGVATATVTAAPLPAGARAQGKACAWTGLCSTFAVQGVGAAEWRIVAVSGASQSVPSSEPLGDLILRIVDGDGDPVAGAPVQIHQAVRGWEASCPASGRCPVAAVLSTSTATLVSDADGLVTIVPTQIDGIPSITQVAAIAGTDGFATIGLEKHP